MSVSDFVSILNRNKTEDGEEDVAEERGDILGLIIRCGSSQSCDFSCELAAKKKKKRSTLELDWSGCLATETLETWDYFP